MARNTFDFGLTKAIIASTKKKPKTMLTGADLTKNDPPLWRCPECGTTYYDRKPQVCTKCGEERKR
jgi:YgiT-type zinc finger domain-containing protein